MSLKHGLLGILNYKDMTGYELTKTFEDSLSFFWQAKASQIYRELNAMEKNGWLISRQIIQSDKPNKRIYTLTGAGKAELARWLSKPQADIESAIRLRSAFLMRLFLGNENSTSQSLDILEAYRKQCNRCLAEMSSAHESIEHYGKIYGRDNAKYWQLTALYGEEYLQASIHWADKAIEILKNDIEGS